MVCACSNFNHATVAIWQHYLVHKNRPFAIRPPIVVVGTIIVERTTVALRYYEASRWCTSA